MGGYGSGRRGYLSKTTVEDCKSLDANDYAKWGCFKCDFCSGSSRWTRNGIETWSCDHRVILNKYESCIIFSYTYGGEEHQDVKVKLSGYKPGFGGKRYFFVCPACGQRKRTLHINQGEIACRLCHNLTYESCKQSHYFDSVYQQMASSMKIPWKAVKKYMGINVRAAKRGPKRPRGRPRKVRTEVA